MPRDDGEPCSRPRGLDERRRAQATRHSAVQRRGSVGEALLGGEVVGA